MRERIAAAANGTGAAVQRRGLVCERLRVQGEREQGGEACGGGGKRVHRGEAIDGIEAGCGGICDETRSKFEWGGFNELGHLAIFDLNQAASSLRDHGRDAEDPLRSDILKAAQANLKSEERVCPAGMAPTPANVEGAPRRCRKRACFSRFRGQISSENLRYPADRGERMGGRKFVKATSTQSPDRNDSRFRFVREWCPK
jgi:hypothetical protein